MRLPNKILNLRSLNIVLFIISNIVVAKEFQNYYLFVFFALFYFFKISKEKFLAPITILLLITSNLAWETIDHRGLINRPAIFDAYFPIYFTDKVILNFGALTVSFIILCLANLLFKKIQISILHKNIFILILLALIWGYVWSEKSSLFYFMMTTTLLVTTFLIRHMQLSLKPDTGLLKSFHTIVPPFFDYVWSIKTISNKISATKQPAADFTIFKKLIEFFLLFYGEKILESVFYTNSILNGLFRVPYIQGLPPQIVLELLSTNVFSKFELVVSLMMVSLYFIGRLLSILLALEAGYLLYGFELRSEFKFFRLNMSFSQYINSILYPIVNLHKDLLIYPWLISKKKFSKISFYSYTAFSVVIFSIFFHTFTEFDVIHKIGFYDFFIKNAVNCLIYTSLLMFAIYLFRRVPFKSMVLLLGMNVLYVFIHGCLIYIRLNFLYTDTFEKLKVLAGILI